MRAWVLVDGATAPGTQAFQRRHDRHRVLDAAPARLWREAVDLGGVEGDLGRLQRRLPALVGDRDVRQRVDQLPREVGLRALHQRRHHDGEADAGRDAGDRHQRLAHAEADVRQRDVEDEASWAAPDLARDDTHTRAVARGAAGAGDGDPLALGEPGQDLDRARAADADLDLPCRARDRRR